MSNPPIPGLCAVCANRAVECNGIEVKEQLGSVHGPGWRSVTGPEMHDLLHAWSVTGRVHADEVRVTHPALIDGEEHLPMFPVAVVGGVGVCATHVGCLLNERRTP